MGNQVVMIVTVIGVTLTMVKIATAITERSEYLVLETPSNQDASGKLL